MESFDFISHHLSDVRQNWCMYDFDDSQYQCVHMQESVE